MTIAVALRCIDGVVVGADGAETFGSGAGQYTMEQHGRKKLHVTSHTIVTVSGFVGDAQRVTDVVSTQWKKNPNLHKAKAITIGRAISGAVVQDFQKTRMPITTNRTLPAALVACATKGGPVLLEYEPDGFQPEVKMEGDTWHACIGSGQRIGDPFLAFLARSLVNRKMPTVAQAKPMVYWTLQHACDVNPGGIGPPIQMAVIEQEPGKGTRKWRARELSASERDLARDNVQRLEEVMAGSWPAVGSSESATEVPEEAA